MIQGFAYRDTRGVNVPLEEVEDRDGAYFHQKTGEKLAQVIAKMSKSLRNVVNPDEIIAEYGADAFRCYEMFMGPLEASKPWNTRDVSGVFKLLQRIWRLVVDSESGALSPALVDDAPDAQTQRVLHKTIKKVGADIEAFKFNTAIGQIFEFVNALTPMERRPRAVIEPFVLLVAPFAPHLAEELWHRLGHAESLTYAPGPSTTPPWPATTRSRWPSRFWGKSKRASPCQPTRTKPRWKLPPWRTSAFRNCSRARRCAK
jgi:leucyl-tRNA synthetase